MVNIGLTTRPNLRAVKLVIILVPTILESLSF